MGVCCSGSQKFGKRSDLLCDGDVADTWNPTWVSMANLIAVGQTAGSPVHAHERSDPPDILDPSCSASQGHWKSSKVTRLDRLPVTFIGIHSSDPISYRVSRSEKNGFPVEKRQFCLLHVINANLGISYRLSFKNNNYSSARRLNSALEADAAMR